MTLPPPTPDTTCLVTGASSGIGAAIARALAERGHGVTLAARREDRLTDLAAEIASEHGVRAETIAVDVTEADERERLRETLAEHGLTVDVLVNNAGYGSGGSFVELDAGKEAAMVRTNVEALVALTAAFLPGMHKRGRGGVINIASLIAFQPTPFQSTYAATKAAVLSFSESLSEEMRGTGVTITAVCPGPVRTEFGEQGGFGGADEKIPDRFWLEADEVAEDALGAFESGDRVVVPGGVNRFVAYLGQHTPRALLLPIARRVWPVE